MIKIKLIYKGNFKDEKSLPKAKLPANAVKFIEPDTTEELAAVAVKFMYPALILIGITILISILIHGRFNYELSIKHLILSLVLPFLTVLPHELLHGICFGKNSEVQLYISPKDFMAFVTSTQPISKRRFIFLSLLPNLVFGWIPLLIWAFMPYTPLISDLLLPFSVICISFGIGDYLNVYNAVKQMPKGSMQILSGFHSYWYMP